MVAPQPALEDVLQTGNLVWRVALFSALAFHFLTSPALAQTAPSSATGTPDTPRVIPLPSSPKAQPPPAPSQVPDAAAAQPLAPTTAPANQTPSGGDSWSDLASSLTQRAQDSRLSRGERRELRRQAQEAERHARREAADAKRQRQLDEREARNQTRATLIPPAPDSKLPGPFRVGAICDPKLGLQLPHYGLVEQAVTPTPAQARGLADLHRAAEAAAAAGRDACVVESPMTPTGQLEFFERRINAVVRAIGILKPTLDSFYSSLSDEQKARFNLLVIRGELAQEPVEDQAQRGRRRPR